MSHVTCVQAPKSSAPASCNQSQRGESATPPGEARRHVNLPALKEFVQCQFLNEGDKMVFDLSDSKEKFLEGEVLLREAHGATIKLDIKHLTALLNDKGKLKEILQAVKKHDDDFSVDEIVKYAFFTTSVTIFVQIAHELQREAAGSQSNQHKCNTTASNPYGDQNLFVMPCTSAQDCDDRLMRMSTFRKKFNETVEWRGRGRSMVSRNEDMSEPHIRGKAYGGGNKRKRESEAGGGGEKQSDGGGNGSVKGGRRPRGSRNSAWRGIYQLNVPARFQSRKTTNADDQHSGRASNEADAQHRAYQRTVVPESVSKDLKLTLEFDRDKEDVLCREFAQLPQAKQGMEKGMRLHIPCNVWQKVLQPDENGCLVHPKGRRYSFKEELLQKCQGEKGIAHMICNPSGGGKYECAYLDYSKMIDADTPHLRCIFVKKRELAHYRSRYPELLLVQLPPGSDALFVGDARFWILAFVTQLRLHAEKQGSRVHAEFFSRCYMLDDDITVFHRIDRDGEEPPKYTAVPLVDVLREQPRGPPETAQLVGLIGYHCRSKHAPGKPDWVGTRDLATPVASVLNISTHVKVQFYMYAELAEDVDFDQRLRLADRGAVLKCNKYCYTRASSGNDVGATRAPDDNNGEYLKALAGACARAFADGKRKHITQAGTYPYLRANHPWALQSALRQLGHYQFTFNRMCGLCHTKAIKHGLFIWIHPEDLPLATPAPPAACVTALRMFLAKLRYSAVFVLPVGTVLPECDRFQQPDTEVARVVRFQLPWKDTTKHYKIVTLVARPPSPSGAPGPSHAESLPLPPTSSPSRSSRSPPSAVKPATAPAPASSHSQAPPPAPQPVAQSRTTSSARPAASKRRRRQASTTETRVASTALTAQEFWSRAYSENENECPRLGTLREWKMEESIKAQKLKDEETQRLKDEETQKLKDQEFKDAGGIMLEACLISFFDLEKEINQHVNQHINQTNGEEQADPRRTAQLRVCEQLASSQIQLCKLAKHEKALDVLFRLFNFRCEKKGGICANKLTELLFKNDDSLPAIFRGFMNILGKRQELTEIFKRKKHDRKWGPFKVHGDTCWQPIYDIIWQRQAREPNTSAGVAESSCQPTRAGEQDGATNETPQLAAGGKRPAKSTGQTPTPQKKTARRDLTPQLNDNPAAQHSHESVPNGPRV